MGDKNDYEVRRLKIAEAARKRQEKDKRPEKKKLFKKKSPEKTPSKNKVLPEENVTQPPEEDTKEELEVNVKQEENDIGIGDEEIIPAGADGRIIFEELPMLSGDYHATLGGRMSELEENKQNKKKKNNFQHLIDMVNDIKVDWCKSLMIGVGLVVATLILTFPFMLTTMSDTELGVGYSRMRAKFMDSVIKSGGVRFKQWGGSVIRWPRVDQTISFTLDYDSPNSFVREADSIGTLYSSRLECNSKDGIKIDLAVELNVKPQRQHLIEITKNFREFHNWIDLVAVQARSTTLNLCSAFSAADFQSNRGLIAETFFQGYFNDLSSKFQAEVSRSQVINIARPDVFENAIVDQENKRSEIALAEAELDQQLTKARTKIDVAENERVRVLDSAETTAAVVLELGIVEAEATLHYIQSIGRILQQAKFNNSLDVPQILSYVESDQLIADGVIVQVDLPVDISFKQDL